MDVSERIREILVEVRRAAEDEEYNKKLREQFPHAAVQSLTELQREIASEIAYSLGKAGRKLERSIAVLELLLERRDRERFSPAELLALRAEFEAQRTHAERCLWELRVQREALGFRRDDDLKQSYVIPRWLS